MSVCYKVSCSLKKPRRLRQRSSPLSSPLSLLGTQLLLTRSLPQASLHAFVCALPSPFKGVPSSALASVTEAAALVSISSDVLFRNGGMNPRLVQHWVSILSWMWCTVFTNGAGIRKTVKLMTPDRLSLLPLQLSVQPFASPSLSS